MASKSFKGATLDLFKTEEPAPEEIRQEAPAPEAEPQALPVKIPETKSRRLQLLIRPATHKALAKEAKKKRISVNELINRICEDHIRGAE